MSASLKRAQILFLPVPSGPDAALALALSYPDTWVCPLPLRSISFSSSSSISVLPEYLGPTGTWSTPSVTLCACPFL